MLGIDISWYCYLYSILWLQGKFNGCFICIYSCCMSFFVLVLIYFVQNIFYLTTVWPHTSIPFCAIDKSMVSPKRPIIKPASIDVSTSKVSFRNSVAVFFALWNTGYISLYQLLRQYHYIPVVRKSEKFHFDAMWYIPELLYIPLTLQKDKIVYPLCNLNSVIVVLLIILSSSPHT